MHTSFAFDPSIMSHILSVAYLPSHLVPFDIFQAHAQIINQMNAACQMVRSFLLVPKWLITGKFLIIKLVWHHHLSLQHLLLSRVNLLHPARLFWASKIKLEFFDLLWLRQYYSCIWEKLGVRGIRTISSGNTGQILRFPDAHLWWLNSYASCTRSQMQWKSYANDSWCEGAFQS